SHAAYAPYDPARSDPPLVYDPLDFIEAGGVQGAEKIVAPREVAKAMSPVLLPAQAILIVEQSPGESGAPLGTSVASKESPAPEVVEKRVSALALVIAEP